MRASAVSLALLAWASVCQAQPDDGLPLPGSGGGLHGPVATSHDTAPAVSATVVASTKPSASTGFLGALDDRPTIRSGSRGQDVRDLQKALKAAGFDVAEDGVFGPATAKAVKEFQRSKNLDADGVVGPKTWGALGGGGTPTEPPVNPPPPPPGATGPTYTATGTGYYPANNSLEGGFLDRLGKPLYTLQAYLAGKAPYVSTAMDRHAFNYGQKIRIPELEKKYGRTIEFRVVDTGDAFIGAGKTRIDICTANWTAAHDKTINGTLHIVVVK